jgi:hypothetical protein
MYHFSGFLRLIENNLWIKAKLNYTEIHREATEIHREKRMDSKDNFY